MKHELTKGYSISPVLKGGWQLAESHSDNTSSTPVEDMFEFVDAGITTFDCADIYTGVEELIGEFRDEYRRRRNEAPPVQVHTKYVPDRNALDTVSRDDVEQIIDRSRARLGVDTLDLVQFHWWDYSVDNYVETASILDDLREEGKIRHIGVTNFDTPHLEELMAAGIPIVSNQVQYSLLDRRPADSMVDFCHKYDIELLCYGTLAGGFLTDRYLGMEVPNVPLENRSLTKYKLIIDDSVEWEGFQALLETLSEIAERRGVSIANVANRFVLERERVCSIIVGARDTTHLADIRRTLDFSLTDADYRAIEQAISGADVLSGPVYGLERNSERHARIMKYNLNEND
ncbi:aldo/keto reductase [Natronosalvus halobius]|uniref:aldo/keto reductase n=1 Tax=Natronosalvus halobius TaxID=2953746 RepID=UPI00209FAB1D|nr:aldo/keto reductase [Natronosalvus halobius]USZ73660.1 aldo/keto reductase [Natronosalvus halobius]